MITYMKGNILESSAQVVTNPVNCVGVMGKGLALQFKNKYPIMFKDYVKQCAAGNIKPGKPYLWEDDFVQILNFPTKRHWRDNSLLIDIEDGLKYLASNYDNMGIDSLAIPPLGCGLGGLDWVDVKYLMEKYLSGIDLEVYIYVP